MTRPAVDPAWVAAQLATAPPLTQAQQQRLRVVLLARRPAKDAA